MSSKLIDIVDRTFGRLRVISLAYRKNTKVYWKCSCACGNTVFVQSASLHQQRTRSCGCLHLDTITKHGNSVIKEHKIWLAMKSRCLNVNDQAYADYGGRGITVCERWAESFDNFFIDMGRCYDNHSIDRIKNNDGYRPDNCKWSTRVEQCNNRRSNIMIDHNGAIKTLTEWCRELNIPYARTWQRINVQNWTVERALN